MASRKFRSVSMVAVAAAMQLGCATSSEDARTYRYRLTVEVETPKGLRSGSSVIQVTGHEASKYAIPGPGLLTYRICGEAVAIDLPNGKTLFAVLRMLNGTSDDAARYAPIAYDSPVFEEDLPRQLAQWLKQQRGARVLPPRNARRDLPVYTEGRTTVRRIGPLPADPEPYYYPMLVTFPNPNDRTSVIAVDARHLERTFGPGFKLKRITTEMTADPVTRTLERRLSWMANFIQTGGLSGGQHSFDVDHDEKNLIPVDFVREQS